MPLSIIVFHRSGSPYSSKADRKAASIASAEYSLNLKPVVSIDGIIQAAGGADHGNRSVAQAVDLAQAAGLVVAGHQEDVRAGLDPMSQRIVVRHFDGESARGRRRPCPPEVPRSERLPSPAPPATDSPPRVRRRLPRSGRTPSGSPGGIPSRPGAGRGPPEEVRTPRAGRACTPVCPPDCRLE